MPTILRHGGFRVAIYPNDHRPAHVHLVKPDRQAVFFLNCPNDPPELRENDGLSAAELRGVAAANRRAAGALLREMESNAR